MYFVNKIGRVRCEAMTETEYSMSVTCCNFIQGEGFLFYNGGPERNMGHKKNETTTFVVVGKFLPKGRLIFRSEITERDLFWKNSQGLENECNKY